MVLFLVLLKGGKIDRAQGLRKTVRTVYLLISAYLLIFICMQGGSKPHPKIINRCFRSHHVGLASQILSEVICWWYRWVLNLQRISSAFEKMNSYMINRDSDVTFFNTCQCIIYSKRSHSFSLVLIIWLHQAALPVEKKISSMDSGKKL